MALNPRIDDWRGRRVWLVGASEGIGAALARQLAARGARLALSARNAGRLLELAVECGPQSVPLPVDVTQPETLERAWTQLNDRWQGIDLVIYMAGTYTPLDTANPAAELLPDLRRMLAVNYAGALEVVGRVVPFFAGGGGPGPRGLVLVGSVAGYGGLPRATGYAPTKAALINLAECLHLELSPLGVGVWVVNPGFVATRLTAVNDFTMPALMQPEDAAAAIIAGLAGGGFEIAFPQRFARLVRAVARLPYAWQLPLIRRFAG